MMASYYFQFMLITWVSFNLYVIIGGVKTPLGRAVLEVWPRVITAGSDATLSCRFVTSKYVDIVTITMYSISKHDRGMIAASMPTLRNGKAMKTADITLKRIQVSGKVLLHDVSKSEIMYDMNDVECRDSGNYTCRIELLKPQKAFEHTVPINVVGSYMVSVKYTPIRLDTNKRPLPFNIGEEVTVRCNAAIGLKPLLHPWTWYVTGYDKSGRRTYKLFKGNISDEPSTGLYNCGEPRASVVRFNITAEQDGEQIICIAKVNHHIRDSFTLYVKCDSKHYGTKCTSVCADRHCQGDKTCKDKQGLCGTGCKPGWQGPTCLKKCDSAHYGENCAFSCASRHCKDDRTCDNVLGHCKKGCISRWSGPTCLTASLKCDSEHYGRHCAFLCAQRHCKDDQSCDNLLGHCRRGCIPGWSRLTCVEPCDSEHYGENCASVCASRHCKDDQTCDNVLGHCKKGCLKGWTGPTCVKRDLNPESKTCTGDSCSTPTISTQEDMESSSNLIFSITGQLLCVVAVAVVVGIILYKRKKKNGETESKRSVDDEATGAHETSEHEDTNSQLFSHDGLPDAPGLISLLNEHDGVITENKNKQA